MLELNGVHAFYGPIEALKGVSLRVEKGEIVSLLGGNGAGKSTTLMTISGVMKARSGEVSYNGRPISGMRPDEVVGLGVCQVPEGRRIFSRLTVRENLDMGAYTVRDKSLIQKNLDEVFGLFPVLKERCGQPGGTLSGGEQQMLAIGRALMSSPELLLLDEPSLGLAPIVVSKIFKIIKDINERGVTVLLVEQNANAALRLAHRAYVIETGRITLEGKASELLANEQVRKAYLGE
ncbi:MAG: ABC transporter ATP-binding protein [Nitrospirae bacterium]|nr:ABC transporter ATP-binding protein [Nitrospirota bacterium]